LENAMPKSLKTPSSVWTLVFRRIVQQLENDASIKRVVGQQNVRSWKGVPGDKAPFAPTPGAPVVRLTPNPRNVDWYSPDLTVGTLYVRVELAVQSLSIDDVADLWDIVVQALQPGGPAVPSSGVSFAQDLVALGAETGEIVCSDPALDPQPEASDEGLFLAAGAFRLRIMRPVNP
jgi:hypothetical protein